MRSDGYVTAAKLKDAYLGIGVKQETRVKLFEQHNVEFAKKIKQPTSQIYQTVPSLKVITKLVMYARIKEEDSGPSSSLAEALEKQGLFINSTLAQLGCNILWKMFRHGMKIRAGETFLYRNGGTESQVFEIRMKSDVNHNCISRAARLAYKRYPYFKSRFKIIDGSVYLCENIVSPPPARVRKLRPLGGSTTSNNLLDITFYKNRIFISFHHAMCDGRGIMLFIKTLLYYYLNFKYPHNNIRIPDVRLVGEGMLPGETADPVNDGNLEFDKSKVYVADRTAFAIPEVQNGEDAGGMSWRYEMTLDVREVIKVCKSNNCTPAILMTILMQKGIKAVNHDATEQILCNMSCDWRESIDLPNTFRNCVSSIYLPYGTAEQEMTMPELGTHFRALISKQKETDSARCSASVMKMMSDMLDSLGSYEKKVETVSGFTSRPINSFICSYTGKANMDDAEKYIESIHVYSSGTKGISLQMMSVGDTFTVDLQQNFPDDTYAKAFLIEASKMGLTVNCSDVIAYITPKDHTANTNFLKSLAGFFKRIIIR